jgi:hypothetical protein
LLIESHRCYSLLDLRSYCNYSAFPFESAVGPHCRCPRRGRVDCSLQKPEPRPLLLMGVNYCCSCLSRASSERRRGSKISQFIHRTSKSKTFSKRTEHLAKVGLHGLYSYFKNILAYATIIRLGFPAHGCWCLCVVRMLLLLVHQPLPNALLFVVN